MVKVSEVFEMDSSIFDLQMFQIFFVDLVWLSLHLGGG